MTHSRWALLSVLAASLFAADSYAQGLRQPASARQTAYDYEYNNYYSQGDDSTSPSDTVAPPADPAAPPADAASASCSDAAPTCAAACEPACGCESSCCDDGCGCGGGLLTMGGLIDPCCTLGAPNKLFDCCALSSRDVTVAGWIGQSFVWNTTNPDDRFNGPVTFTDRSNEYQLNQLYLYADWATSNDGSWDIGGRIDAMYGTDYRFTTAAGLETEGYYTNPVTNGDHRFYGLAMPQAYAQFRKGDFWVNVGHFYAPVGYEGVMMTSPTNFFFTHAYTHQYGEPFTFTGVIANYLVNDVWTIGGGFTRGWDNWGGGKDYRNPHLGGVVTATRTLEDAGTLALSWVFGPEQTLEAGYFQQRFLQSIVWTNPLEDDWTFVLQSDQAFQNDAYGRGGRDAWWYGLNGYLFKKISDCWTWGMNAEWFRDEEGVRVGGFLGTDDDGSLRGLSTGRFGYNGNFYQISLGANWRPNANWNVRPAVRFDWYDGNENQFNAEGKPFDDGNGNSQTLLGFDAIYSY